MSLELQQLLAEAEQRAQAGHDSESIIPSPEEEIEAVLPAELLAALDEPMEEDEDEDEGLPARSAHYSGGTGDGGGSRTTVGDVRVCQVVGGLHAGSPHPRRDEFGQHRALDRRRVRAQGRRAANAATSCRRAA